MAGQNADSHPQAILVFGGVWGFWGVFFAVPLASVVQAVVESWPRQRLPDREDAALPERQAAS